MARNAPETAALRCNPDIRICRVCIGWLAHSAGVIDVTPTFPVASIDEAQRFYEAAGFHVRRYDDGFAFVTLDDQSVCDLGLESDLDTERNRAGCYVTVTDVDAWHARLCATGQPLSPVEVRPWGMREFSVRDPSGNSLRIGQPSG